MENPRLTPPSDEGANERSWGYSSITASGRIAALPAAAWIAGLLQHNDGLIVFACLSWLALYVGWSAFIVWSSLADHPPQDVGRKLAWLVYGASACLVAVPVATVLPLGLAEIVILPLLVGAGAWAIWAASLPHPPPLKQRGWWVGGAAVASSIWGAALFGAAFYVHARPSNQPDIDKLAIVIACPLAVGAILMALGLARSAWRGFPHSPQVNATSPSVD